MAEINDWEPQEQNNQDAPPNGFPEGMEYSDVNNSAREVMAVLARFYRDENGSLTATGINDLTFTTNAAYPLLYQGLRIGFRATNTNTGAMTIQLNALSAAPFLNTAGAIMQAGSIAAGLVYFAVYNGSAFQLISNGFTFPGGNPGLFSAALPTVIPALDDRVALTDTSDADNPKFASILSVNQLINSPYTLTDPAETPEGLDRFPFQDISDANNTKTATANQIAAAAGLLFRTSDTSGAPALADLLSFQDASDSNAARTTTASNLFNLLFSQSAVAPASADILTLQDASDSNNIRTSTVGSLLGAFNVFAGVNLVVNTTSGTYNKPSNLSHALVIVIGGGGGGGATPGPGNLPDNFIAAGAGGVSGAVSVYLYSDAELAAATTYVVGTGGVGGTPASFTGGSGTISRFNFPAAGTGPVMAAGGGAGGTSRQFNTASEDFILTQSSSLTPTGSGGSINVPGKRGSPSIVNDFPVAVGGNGGDCLFGSGGRGGEIITATRTDAGAAGGGFGGGGGGGAAINPTGLPTSANGGAGAGGAVIILEFLGT